MSEFKNINYENKIRIALSAYAANIIESDCFSFSKKKNSLLNSVILNFYQKADCSISIRIREYKQSLVNSLTRNDAKINDKAISLIVHGKETELKKIYTEKTKSDANWTITLSMKTVQLLTDDHSSSEEKYYKSPAIYIKALLEEYSRLPYYQREKIIFKNILDDINTAIKCCYAIKLTNIYGKHFYVKPYMVENDPLSMYQYVIGYNYRYDEDNASEVLGIRLSRLKDAEIQYYQDGTLTPYENKKIQQALRSKGVQFVSGNSSEISIWLSDEGIRKYNEQQHLRPLGRIDDKDNHIYHFDCTEIQILFYFLRFGKDARIISPDSLKDQFKEFYNEAYKAYK